MFGKLIPKLIFAGALLACGVAWAADPSVDQIYQAAKAGNYSQAQGLMDQVLRDHPNSAKAHFIQSELYAKQGKLNAARGELQKAQQIDPDLSFAKPRAVQELKSQLSSGSGAAQNGRIKVPWGPLLGGLAVLVFILMLVRSRAQRAAQSGPAASWRPAGPGGPVMPGGGAYGPGGGYGPGGAMMPPAAGGGLGSGIMGGLATGAAVGAGMVAGEALMHKVMGGGTQGPVVIDNGNPTQDAIGNNADMGGNDFGVNDGGSWDDGSSSGTDWGSGDSGWSDSGGGSDDDWST